MKLWPFSRKQDEQSDLPQEVQDYYQAEKRERVGVAGLLALGTLVVTILLAIGLFFGGRWAYRTVFDNDDNQQTAQQDNEQEQDQEAEDGENQGEADQDETANNEDEEPAPAPSTPQPSPSPTPTPSPSPSGPVQNNGDLPSTGPADNLAIFLGTVVLASVLFYLVRQPERE